VHRGPDAAQTTSRRMAQAAGSSIHAGRVRTISREWETYLAVALGVRAIERGFSVLFHTLDELLHHMRKDAAVSAQALKRKNTSTSRTWWSMKSASSQ